MRSKVSAKSLLPRLVIIAAVILLAVLILAGVWWRVVWQSPERVFEDMLANNLATTSVTRHALTGSGDQTVDSTTRLQMGSANLADWLVAATESGSSVTTETVGTPSTGYLRYVHAADKSGTAQYAKFLNVWAKGDGKIDTDLGLVFSETILDINNTPTPPIANLPAAKRETLLASIRGNKVFTPNYSKIKQGVVDGRPVDTFSVAIQLSAYVGLMQAFAHDLGLSNLDQLDANQYVGAPAVMVTMSVDRLSHQLVRIANADGSFTQTYGDWGLQTNIAVPNARLTTSALQQRLQATVKK